MSGVLDFNQRMTKSESLTDIQKRGILSDFPTQNSPFYIFTPRFTPQVAPQFHPSLKLI
jgi:hypothetical protein